MGEGQGFGAQELVGKPQGGGEGRRLPAGILGVAQDGKAGIGAVEPKLVGASGEGAQGQSAIALLPLQHGKGGLGRLPVRADLPQQAGQGTAGDGRVDNARILPGAAVHQGMVGFLKKPLGVESIHFGVDHGVFCQKNDAEGVPVQPGDGMEGAVLPGAPVIAQHPVGQRSRELGPGGMHQKPCRLVHCQKVVILIQYGDGSAVRRVVRSGGVQKQGDLVPGGHREVRMLRPAVHQDGAAPFQPVHQSGGDAHLLF